MRLILAALAILFTVLVFEYSADARDARAVAPAPAFATTTRTITFNHTTDFQTDVNVAQWGSLPNENASLISVEVVFEPSTSTSAGTRWEYGFESRGANVGTTTIEFSESGNEDMSYVYFGTVGSFPTHPIVLTSESREADNWSTSMDCKYDLMLDHAGTSGDQTIVQWTDMSDLTDGASTNANALSYFSGSGNCTLRVTHDTDKAGPQGYSCNVGQFGTEPDYYDDAYLGGTIKVIYTH